MSRATRFLVKMLPLFVLVISAVGCSQDDSNSSAVKPIPGGGASRWKQPGADGNNPFSGQSGSKAEPGSK